jgi:hypothetical protein
MLGNLIRSFQLQDKPYYDPDDPWGGILMAVAFGLRSTYHMTQQEMPGQLVFGRDMVLNVQHLTDYKVGDLVMLKINRANKYEQPYSRPYRITQVNMIGTVHLKINAVMDTVNIQCIHPFKTPVLY